MTISKFTEEGQKMKRTFDCKDKFVDLLKLI